jgi:ubiquitin-activating enzyme E1
LALTRAVKRCAAAKNLILAGVKAVTLHDTETVQLRDLGSQFYLSEDNVGGNRASACQAKLQELNTAVAVSATTQDLSDAFLASFDVRCVC